MDCFSLFLFFCLLIGGIVKFGQWVGNKSLESGIQKAWEEKDYSEYYRLCEIRNEREYRNKQAERENENNQRYLDRLFVLDAAEHGVFAPGAERVFDDDDEENSCDEEDYSEEESYYDNDDSYNDYPDDEY